MLAESLISFRELYAPVNEDTKVCFSTMGLHDNYNGNQAKVKQRPPPSALLDGGGNLCSSIMSLQVVQQGIYPS